MVLNRLSRNSLILLTSNVGTAGLAFALNLIVARGLGDAALGQYAAIMAWVFPLTLLVDFGISTLITRNVAQNYHLARSYLGQALPLRVAIGGIVIILIWFLAPYLSNDEIIVDGLRIGILLVLIDALFANFTAIFRAWERMRPILILNIGLLLTEVVFAILVVHNGGTVVHLLAGIVIADSLQLLFTWLVWRHLIQEFEPTDNPSSPGTTLSTQQLLKLATPFMIAGVIATLHLRGVIIILDQYVSASEMGWYAGALRILEAARMIPQAIFGALFPALSALVINPPQMRATFRKIISILFAYCVLVSIFIFSVGGWVLAAIFGEAFFNIGEAFSLLAIAFILSIGRGALTLWYYAFEREAQVNQYLLAGLVVQIISGVVLIQAYGLTGAATASMIAESVMLIQFLWQMPSSAT